MVLLTWLVKHRNMCQTNNIPAERKADKATVKIIISTDALSQGIYGVLYMNTDTSNK